MGNLTVAVLLLDLILKVNYDSFQLFDNFAKSKNITLNYVIWKGCSSNLTVDAYILDPKDFIGCEEKVFLPLVIEHQALAVMMPIMSKKDRYKDLLMPVDALIQICSTLVMVFFAIFSTMSRKLYSGSTDFIGAVLIGFKLVVGQSVLKDKRCLFRLLYLLISLYGIMICNLYSANMSKFLVMPEDDTSCTTLCTTKGIEFLGEIGIAGNFKLEATEAGNLFLKIGSLNLENGYCVKTSDWTKRLHFQHDLKKNMFKLAIPWIEGFKDHTLSIMNPDSEYAEILNTFILDVYSTGLVNKWAKDMSIKKFAIKFREIQNLPQIVLFDDLRMLFVYFGFGAVTGVLSFFLEVVVNRVFK
ncbi:hypothetical protein ACFFRR_003558 [Megaselia abdita]